MLHLDIPFALVGIDHIVFPVDVMPRARAFYRDVLGCGPGYTYPAIGMEPVWTGNALIVLWDNPPRCRHCRAARGGWSQHRSRLHRHIALCPARHARPFGPA